MKISNILIITVVLTAIQIPGSAINHSCVTEVYQPKDYSYEYFYSLPFRESPYRRFNGILPTTKEKAQRRNHYRFTYDDQNRVIEVALMKNNRLVINSNSNNFFMGVARIKFEFVGNKETLSFYNFRNERIPFVNIWESVYEYDTSGNRIALKHYDSEGKLSNNHWGIAEYKWEVDEQGRVKEQRFDISGEQAMIRPRFDFYEVRLTFDERGYLTKMENYGKDGALTLNSLGVAIDKLVYDENGNFTQWKVYNEKGDAVIGNLPGTAGGNHYYNDFGDQIKTEVFDLDDQLMIGNWGYAYQVTDFDETGNTTRIARFDENKKMLRFFDEVYWVGFKSNELNHLIEVGYYDKEGNITMESQQNIASATYQYDEAENMIERKYFDQNGQLVVNKLRGFAVEKYIHDYSTGKVDSIRYDTKMQIIPKE